MGFTGWLQQEQTALREVLQNFPCGVLLYTSDIPSKVVYANDEFLRMTGNPREQPQKNLCSWRAALLDETEQQRVEPLIKQQFQRLGRYRVDYRIKQNGEERWLFESGRKMDTAEDVHWVFATLTDITGVHYAKKKLHEGEKRYRVIMEHTNSILYDWDLQKDRAVFTNVWKTKFGYNTVFEHMGETFVCKERMHPDDLPACKAMLDTIRNGVLPYAEETIRFCTAEGNYIWCRSCLTAAEYVQGKPTRAVGVIFDVDREKRETESMQKLAQRDCLTGLYNRGAAEQWICKCLCEKALQTHAFFMIDIDNFKHINDTLGHAWGDIALQRLAEALRKPFRSSDVISRVGGDEFAVFIEGASPELARAKAQALCEEFQSLLVGSEENAFRLTGSVGVALYPQDGVSFSEMYKNADKALYCAKAQGKNQYCFYKREQEPI